MHSVHGCGHPSRHNHATNDFGTYIRGAHYPAAHHGATDHRTTHDCCTHNRGSDDIGANNHITDSRDGHPNYRGHNHRCTNDRSAGYKPSHDTVTDVYGANDLKPKHRCSNDAVANNCCPDYSTAHNCCTQYRATHNCCAHN